MDLRQLRHFVVLAEHLNYRRASDSLDISQPTLSQQMIALEKDLGAILFERTKRSVRLSNAGHVYLAEVRVLLDRLDVANDHAREAHRGRLGELVVGASGPATIGGLPAVVAAFRERYPQVALRLRVMRSEDIAVAIREREVHLGIGRVPADGDGIVTQELWEHPFRIVIPSAHPAARGATVSLGELAGSTLITLPRRTIGETYDQVIALCNHQGFEPHAIEEANGLESAFGMVACGIGVYILAAPWEEAIKLADVTFKPIADSLRWKFRIAAYWHKAEQSRLVPAFVSLARRRRRAS